MAADPPKPQHPDTALTHAGLKPFDNHGIVNPPVYHASTVLSPTLDAYEAKSKTPFDTVNYGRVGTPTSWAFEEAVTALEGGFRSVSVSSGQAAVTTALMAYAAAGNHVLIPDSAYGPTRILCQSVLKRFGVEAEFYDPRIGAGIADRIRDTTALIYLESPGSLTFEVQDVPAIVAVAKDRGLPTLLDNTWATGYFFPAIAHGVDVVVHAATKYIVGHADTMMGVITAADEPQFLRIKTHARQTGQCAGPDDHYLALRGLRTLPVRLARHQENALVVARWLEARPEVARVIHPGLESHPDHALFKRDFKGSTGLFQLVLRGCTRPQLAAFLDGLAYFPMGESWGGYESLAMPNNPAKFRTATPWKAEGPCIRLHVGLEDPADLIADLDAGFGRMAEARAT